MKYKHLFILGVPALFLATGVLLVAKDKFLTIAAIECYPDPTVWHSEEIPNDAIQIPGQYQYWKNSSHVYVKIIDEQRMIVGADPATFFVFPKEGSYAKDSKRVYYGACVLNGADPATFSVLDVQYGKDTKHVYFRWFPLKGADVNSFELVEDKFAPDGSRVYTAQDKNHKYLWEEVIE